MDMSDEALAAARRVLDYAEQLRNAAQVPEIPEPFAEDAAFLRYHEDVLDLRRAVSAFAGGDLSVVIKSKGFFAGACKALQAHLRHMTWVVQQIEHGDYTQRIDFLGDFSRSFNRMTERLKTTIDDLHQKEEALTSLALSLQKEARKRSDALLELKKSEQRFKELADHDSLTTLLNRRAFFAGAEMRVQNASFRKQTCCVCLIDVDHFKDFNDTFGHLEGDRALQHVVQICRHRLRLADIMGRYGGEEFIILFSLGMEQSREAVERLRQALENTPFLLENGETTPLTASFGVAVILPDKTADHAEALRSAIAKADTAMYSAKREGRNRVCLDSSEAPATLTATAPRAG